MQFGDYHVEVIPDTEFCLDGGAMFGVVPRNLWSRVSPPDDQNRVRLNMNCLFIDTGRDRILIDTGIGEKWSEKQREIYGINRQRPFKDSLRVIAGCEPEDISIVVNTHLHFDHCGGNTELDDSGRVTPAFVNARYFVSDAELQNAQLPSERDRASYVAANWQPLSETGQLELKQASYEVAPGLQMENVSGHNRSMQCWRLVRGGRTLFGFSDLVPTRAHLPYAWVMGYDLYPVETVEGKKKLLPQAARENWTCLFYHDADEPLACLVEQEGRIRAQPVPAKSAL